MAISVLCVCVCIWGRYIYYIYNKAVLLVLIADVAKVVTSFTISYKGLKITLSCIWAHPYRPDFLQIELNYF